MLPGLRLALRVLFVIATLENNADETAHLVPCVFAGRPVRSPGNSSINDNMGTGDPKEGDLDGGIDLSFDWKDVKDEEGKWSARLSNELAKNDMTADVTPRRCQKFRPEPGDKLTWTDSADNTGTVVADANGLATVTAVKIKPGAEMALTIGR